MLEDQGGCCGACNRPVTIEFTNVKGERARNKAVVDHCHKSGKVRGVLCNGCNIGLGAFEENPDRLRAALEYLAKHTPLP